MDPLYKRYPRYYKDPDGQDVRDVWKVYGIKFEILVSGEVGITWTHAPTLSLSLHRDASFPLLRWYLL